MNAIFFLASWGVKDTFAVEYYLSIPSFYLSLASRGLSHQSFFFEVWALGDVSIVVVYRCSFQVFLLYLDTTRQISIS